MSNKYKQRLLRQDDFLTIDEAKKLYKAVDKRYVKGMRDYAILKVYLNCGLRKSELIGLTVGDYHKENGIAWLSVKGKGGQILDQMFNSSTTIKAIDKYLKTAGHKDNLKTPLFRAIGKGKVSTDRGIQRTAIDFMLNKYAKKAKLQKHLHCHMLRHTFGSAFFKQTGNIITTQQALRHKSGSATLIYLHSDKKQMLEGLKQLTL